MDKQKTSMAKLVFKPLESKPLSERFKDMALPDLDKGLRELLIGKRGLTDLFFPKPKR